MTSYDRDCYEAEEVPQVKGRRETISFELSENGCMEESQYSIRQRIAAMWGFRTASIELMDADFGSTPMELGDQLYYACNGVRFTVAGVGWATDFCEITRANTYDQEGGESR